MRREIHALTAEGRLSAVVLALAPPILAVILYFTAPDYIATLFNHTIGLIAVGGACVLAVVGYAWLRRIVDIEV